MARRKQKTTAAHPGEILRTEFMAPMGLTAYQMANALHFPGIYEIVREQRTISADVAIRLGKYFWDDPGVEGPYSRRIPLFMLRSANLGTAETSEPQTR